MPAAVRAGLRAPWGKATAHARAATSPMPAALPQTNAMANPWGLARRLARADFCAWPNAETLDTAHAAPWGRYTTRPRADRLTTWPAATVADTDRAATWGQYPHHRRVSVLSVWPAATVADIARLAPWQRYAAQHGQAWTNHTPAGITADVPLAAPWGSFARRLNAEWGVPSPHEDEPPPGTTRITPILRSYIVVNEISLVRVSNNLALPALALSIAADADSWTYRWSASVPGDKLDDVLPGSPGEPVEFQASINGWPHRLIAERISLDRTHGKHRVQISGRGLAAKLAAPYLAAEARSNAAGNRTAQQLCDDALLINAVPASGWTINWNLTDWLVPAGAWVTLGTPMDAITAIAEAAGGYVRPHPTTKTLHIEHRYPVKPWEWGTATPSYELPVDATTKAAIEWRENPPYNAVYVAGTGPGAILARVKRTGTAGDHVAPLATDPLITHADAARQRGTAILGSAGSGQTLTLETPVLAAIGPYVVGSLVRFLDGTTERIGIVRACNISAALPKVRQTLEIECHD